MKELTNKIFEIIEEVTGVTRTQMINKDRHLPVAMARNAACYLLRKTRLSTNQIGRLLNRHHSTVISASNRFNNDLFTKDFQAVKIMKKYEELFHN